MSSKWYKSVSPLDARSSGCEQWVSIKILQTLERKKNNNIEGEEEAGQRMVQWEDNSQNRTFVVVCLGNHSRNSSVFLCFKLKKCIYLFIANKDSRENLKQHSGTHLDPLCWRWLPRIIVAVLFILFSFAQWRYHSQWGFTDAWLLWLVEKIGH